MATPVSSNDAPVGLHRLATGAGLGLAAGLVGVVLPLSFFLLATYNPGGFFTFGALLIETTSILLIAGSILFLLSLFVYRRGFLALRHSDPRFNAPAVLCIVGSVGFLLILLMALLLFGTSSSLVQCLHGQPSHALSCFRANQPLGAYTGLIGFGLGWIGGLGIVLGLVRAGSRFHAGGVTGGAALYGLLLLVLVGPLLRLLLVVPDIQYLALVAPVLAVMAPGVVYGAIRRHPLMIA
jgi:hypothetical protein